MYKSKNVKDNYGWINRLTQYIEQIHLGNKIHYFNSNKLFDINKKYSKHIYSIILLKTFLANSTIPQEKKHCQEKIKLTVDNRRLTQMTLFYFPCNQFFVLLNMSTFLGLGLPSCVSPFL